MADIVSKETRSRMMSGIRNKNTKPELLIRRNLHARGFRYLLHNTKIPGTPDLAFPKYNALIFVHGCFWHGHNCHLFRYPASRPEFWKSKIDRNIERDHEVALQLHRQGWRILVVWECALKGKEKLPINDMINEIVAWLVTSSKNTEIRGSTNGL